MKNLIRTVTILVFLVAVIPLYFFLDFIMFITGEDK